MSRLSKTPVMLGEPEYDPSQKRDKSGKWSKGGGGKGGVATGKEEKGRKGVMRKVVRAAAIAAVGLIAVRKGLFAAAPMIARKKVLRRAIAKRRVLQEARRAGRGKGLKAAMEKAQPTLAWRAMVKGMKGNPKAVVAFSKNVVLSDREKRMVGKSVLTGIRVKPKIALGRRAGLFDVITHRVTIATSTGRGWKAPLKMGDLVVDSSVTGAFRHELGHAFHFSLGQRRQKEWRRIYKSASPVSFYGDTNALEGFAESVTAFLHPSYGKGGMKLPSQVEGFLSKIIK